MLHNQLGMKPCDYENDEIFNSLTEKRNNVQPRTGLFEACVPLPKVAGNLGFGPEIDMSLFYSPVVNNVSALGDGWSFAFTTYHEDSGKLALHTGEVLAVAMDECLTTASVVVQWGMDTLCVEYKDGRTEILKSAGKCGLWMPARLTTDGYRYVALSWDFVRQEGDAYTPDGYQARLVNIRNDTPADGADPAAVKAEATRKLVSLEYEPQDAPSLILLTFWPGSEEELVYVLAIEDVALKSITPPEGEASRCDLKYVDDRKCGWILTGIRTFDGLTEAVEYVPETRSFEDDVKLKLLPCVTRHTITPRAGGKPVVTTFAYSQNTKDSSAAYTTTLTELASSGARTTVYVYDSSYTMVSETTTRGTCAIERKFRHAPLTADSSSGANVPPRSVRTTQVRFVRPGISRTELSNSYFEGSKLKAVHSKCNKTGFTFSSEGSFSDAYLTREVTNVEEFIEPLDIPVDGSALDQLNRQIYGSPTASRTISYVAIDGLNRKKSSYVITVLSAQGNSIGQETSYFTAGYRKGLTATVRQGVGLSSEVRESGSLTAYEYTLKGTTMTVMATETRGGESRTTSRSVSILSGRCLSEVDASGNVTAYAFDSAGRLTSSTVCKGTEYSEVTGYMYPGVGRMEVTEADGRRRAVESDGRENVIKEEVYESGRWNAVSVVEYDELGRKAVLTTFDTAGIVAIKETCAVAYDDWNEPWCRTYGDGRVEFDRFDPVFLVRDEWEGKETDKHRKRTFYRPDDRVICIRQLDAQGVARQGEAYLYYDARLASVVTANDVGTEEVAKIYDGLGRVTELRRKFWGRSTLSATPLPITGSGDVSERDWSDSELKSLLFPVDHIVAYTYRRDDYVNAEPTSISFFDAGAYEALHQQEGPGLQQRDFPQGTDPRVASVRRLGEREFDVWGRVTSMTRAGIKEQMTYESASPSPKTIAKADGSLLTYDYIAELDYRPSRVRGSGVSAAKSKSFTYARGTKRQSTAKEGSSELAFDHDLNEWPNSEKMVLAAGAARGIQKTRSQGGRLLSEVDATGGKVSCAYNTLGQRTRTQRGSDVDTTHEYNSAGLLALEKVRYVADEVSVTYAYDALYREIGRTFVVPAGGTLTMERTYDTGGRVGSMRLIDGTRELGSKGFTYDRFGRLRSCMTTGVWRPSNPKGRPIDAQTFTYDGLGNVTACSTRFGDATCNSTYSYDESGCRLLTVTHDHDDYVVGGKRSVELTYDSCGRLTRDAYGKTYDYDWLGRLARAGSRYYSYDAMDRLASCGSATEQRQVIFDGMGFRGEHGQGDTGRYFYPGSAACSIQRVKLGGVDRTLFELCDGDGTVLVTYDRTARAFKHHAYTAYGEQSSSETDSLLGFQGAYRDVDGTMDRYPLGQGYRWYAPCHMQFNAPDSESPYGMGGVHAYGYCDGDPVNRQDPSGHAFGWLASALDWTVKAVSTAYSYTPVGMLLGWVQRSGIDWLKKTVKIGEALTWGVIGIAGAVFTGGASLALIGIAVTLAAISVGTEVASILLSDTDPDTAKVLGWISFGTGVGSAAGGFGAGIAGKVGPLMKHTSRWMKDVVTRTTRVTAFGSGKGARIGFRAIPKSGLGALAGTSQGAPQAPRLAWVVSGTESSAFARFVDRIRPFADFGGAAINVVGGALGNAGVFDNEATNAAVGDHARRVGVTTQTLFLQPDFVTSLAGKAWGGWGRLKFR